MSVGKLLPVPELIAIDLPGGSAFVDALRRAWDRGDAVLALDQRLAAPAQEALLRALRPGRLLRPDSEARLPGGLPVEPGDAVVVATSGTTGGPKGVVLTHEAVAASARAISARLGVDPARHRWLACLPLSHIGGLSVVTRALLTDTSLEVLPGFDATAVQQRSGPDVLVSLVPTALSRVDAARFRTVVLGGSATPADLPPNVVTTYGMTETGSGVVYDGLPLDGVDVRIRDGEIHLRGPMLLRAYRDGIIPLDGDGWLATGDGGWIGEFGRLHVEGRMTDLIITGGENVWPEPVEALLCSHPGVAEAAIAGRPDPEWGQRVVAFVVPANGRPAPTLEELRGVVRDRLAAFAAPKELVVVDELPRTAIGKVRRDLLSGDSPPNENRF